jgi:hypothetical protein
MMKPLIALLILAGSVAASAQIKPPSHDIYDRLLKKHVTAHGKVNYKGFIRDTLDLNKYLDLLSKTPPDEKTWSRYEQMAYWINAYNAFTIKLITKYYPVKSIKDIGSSVQIPFVNTPWDIKFIRIGKEKMDLNNIEHGQLRKKFNDPRVHMALVCASKSCPILLNEAYDASRFDEQLARQTKAFLSDPYRNKMSATAPQLSMIFKWYGMDFNKNGGSVRDFINTYSEVKIAPSAKISHLDYDWGLNEQ